MSASHRAQLKKIRTFPALVGYLRDEMDWPIGTGDFEELTFDYTPEELGIERASAAKIQEIKRLRPLSADQPWGIFFVKFEPKSLPVVALRRILSRVVLKKRASANSAERAAWQVDDLLFVSNFGKGNERRISFAHFSQDEAKNDLPTLKVLGWDNLDTQLHLDQVADALRERLAWPEDEGDAELWRATWRSAFTLRHGEVITTSKDLSIRLAELARSIRDRIKTVLGIETEDGPISKLMAAFQEALIHDLDSDGFADMYAQTIAYGLLSARITDPKSKTADDFSAHMRTNPFLGELMETFLKVGGRKGKAGDGSALDFDELGVSEVVEVLDGANMEAVVRDFGDRNPQEDPVIHFYELFLKEYAPKARMQRGVFYTPRPVVSYIVRSVHERLRTEFGLADGLADTASWGEVAKRHQGLTIPKGVKATDRFVTVLDPATGTGTFLVEAIEVIYGTLVEKWKQEGHNEDKILDLWNAYVPKHLLPRLHGYELLMAPYAIAHLKIGLTLHETGYRFESEERARVYLTNALEPAHDFSGQFEFAIPALAHEAEAVNAVKEDQRFTVFIGNPPYSVLSGNLTTEARELIDPYRSVDGERIQEKSMLRLEMHLQDDYIKFFRISEDAIQNARSGVVGMITNSGYLDSLSLRGMRYSLLRTFENISLLNLHGSQQRATDTTRAAKDQNVFDIVQGVAIFLGSRLGDREGIARVRYSDLYGDRESKYATLSQALADGDEVRPAPSHYYFEPVDNELQEEFQGGFAVNELFRKSVTGMVTAHDHLVIDFSDDKLRAATRLLRDGSKTDSAVREALTIKDNAGWKLAKARTQLRESKDGKHWYKDIDYRPFDRRRINYHPALVWSDRRELMQSMQGPTSLALSTCRQLSALPWTHVLVGRSMVESAFVSNKSREICHVMPLWLLDSGEGLFESEPATMEPNLSTLAKTHFLTDGDAERSPESLLNYVYAQLHSPTYRSRYEGFLKRDFPRVFPPKGERLFSELDRIGAELVALHLVETPAQRKLSARYDKTAKTWRFKADKQRLPVTLSFIGPEKPVVGKIGWSDDTVWLDAVKSKNGGDTKVTGTIGFHGVTEEVWNFQIGAYQVCEKWLKDRGPKKGQPGRTLAAEDLAHYHRIVIALHETLRLMGEVDEVIETRGGWPDAFQVAGPADSKVAASAR